MAPGVVDESGDSLSSLEVLIDFDMRKCSFGLKPNIIDQIYCVYVYIYINIIIFFASQISIEIQTKHLNTCQLAFYQRLCICHHFSSFSIAHPAH